MRFVRFRPLDRKRSRLGFVLRDGRIIDLQLGAKVCSPEIGKGVRSLYDLRDVMAGGMTMMKMLAAMSARAQAGEQPFRAVAFAASDVELEAPLRPGKIITVARNYRDHLREYGIAELSSVPSASIKSSESIVGPNARVLRPPMETRLDYETELAVVIGTRCRNVRERDAYEVVFGYTILCDIVARDILATERKAGGQYLGKVCDTFGPLGPCVVTPDELPNPMAQRITTRVNDHVRQDANTREMIFSIPQLISYFSQATLEPGDIISTGTPAGVAAGRPKGDDSWYLSPGDVLESEIESIGCIRVCISADTEPSSWTWPNA